MRKKLITTNKQITDYDFYHPNNIYVISDPQYFEIPQSFFDTEYTEIDESIREKYHQRSWTQRITSL